MNSICIYRETVHTFGLPSDCKQSSPFSFPKPSSSSSAWPVARVAWLGGEAAWLGRWRPAEAAQDEGEQRGSDGDRARDVETARLGSIERSLYLYLRQFVSQCLLEIFQVFIISKVVSLLIFVRDFLEIWLMEVRVKMGGVKSIASSVFF